MGADLNVLRITDWNMCRNAEWMVCVVAGKADYADSSSGEIIFTYAPAMLNIDEFNSRPGMYIEDDIYYLEVCVLNEMCTNYEEIFQKGEGDSFFCKFDHARWSAWARDMRKLG